MVEQESGDPRQPGPGKLPRQVRQALFANGLFICAAGVATLIHDQESNPSNAQGTFLALNAVGLPLLVGALRSPRANRQRLVLHLVIQAALLFMWSSLTLDWSNRRFVYIPLWLACGLLSLRALISLSREEDDPDRLAALRKARRAARVEWRGSATRRVTSLGASGTLRLRPAPVLIPVAYFAWTGYRYASIPGMLAAVVLIAAVPAAVYGVRHLRARQSVLLAEGVIVVHRWDLRPLAFRADRIRAIALARVLWGNSRPAALLVIDAGGACIARVLGAEWDAESLSAALEPLGIPVVKEDEAPMRPREIEAACPGAMRSWELHPAVSGMVIIAGCLFVATVVRAGFGALTGR